MRKIALVLIMAAVLGLAALWYTGTRTEPAYIAARDIPRHAQVVADDVQRIELPRRRDQALQSLTAPPLGKWATVHVPAGALLAEAMFSDSPPDRRVVGEILLPEGWRGYVLVVQSPLMGELRPGDLVDVVLQQPGKGEALLLLQKAPLLKLAETEEDQVRATLALQPEQAVILDAYLRGGELVGDQEEQVLPLLLLTQEANPDLPPLTRFDLRSVVPELFEPIGPLEDAPPATVTLPITLTEEGD